MARNISLFLAIIISVLELHFDRPVMNDPSKKDISTTTAIRLALDRAATVDEVISLWSRYNMYSPKPGSDFHFLVSDATGKHVVIEFLGSV